MNRNQPNLAHSGTTAAQRIAVGYSPSLDVGLPRYMLFAGRSDVKARPSTEGALGFRKQYGTLEAAKWDFKKACTPIDSVEPDYHMAWAHIILLRTFEIVWLFDEHSGWVHCTAEMQRLHRQQRLERI